MVCMIAAEASIFVIFVVAYLYYAGKSLTGPLPKDVLRTPVFYTVCLLSSSLTIHLAEKALHRRVREGFLVWWGLTILLGLAFLAGTAVEWTDLIGNWKLTISRNLFGSTYFTLVGFHAAHVTIGWILLIIVFGLGVARQLPATDTTGVTVVGWYWHFVDGVWIVVFTLVYVVARGMS